MKYVSLHTHTTFSFGDGFGPVPEHVSRISDLGMDAVALTEHGNVSSWVQLEKACRATLSKKGKPIKPIFGIEIYTAPPKERRKCHMILLAANQQGLMNINRIVTQSWVNFYQFPTVHWDSLRANSVGIIALSGCSDSHLSCTLFGGKSLGEKRLECNPTDFQRSRIVVEKYQKVFGDRYFLECQRFPLLERSCSINQKNEELSTITGVPLVATSDVHYPTKEQQPFQKILHAAHRGGDIDTIESAWEWDVKLTYPVSDEQIQNDLEDTGMSTAASLLAIQNTATISDRCNVELPKAPMPKYQQSEDDWDEWK